MQERIEAKSKALASAVKSTINAKQLELNRELEKSMKREKADMKKVTSRFLGKLECKVKEQCGRVAKLREKIDRVSKRLEELERRAAFKNIEQIRAEVDKELKEKFEKCNQVREEQKRHYKSELEGLSKACIETTQSGYGKLKNLL